MSAPDFPRGTDFPLRRPPHHPMYCSCVRCTPANALLTFQQMRQDAQRQPVRRSSTEADVKNGLTWAFIVVVMVAFALLLAVLMWLIVVHAITPP